MRTRRFVANIAASLVVIGFLSGCGGSESNGEYAEGRTCELLSGLKAWGDSHPKPLGDGSGDMSREQVVWLVESKLEAAEVFREIGAEQTDERPGQWSSKAESVESAAEGWQERLDAGDTDFDSGDYSVPGDGDFIEATGCGVTIPSQFVGAGLG